MKEYFDSIIKTISASVNSLDYEKLNALTEACVNAIESGHKIIVSGLGKNVPVCDKFVGTMNSVGQPAVFMNTNSAVHGDIGMVKEDDIVIILTKSGETEESVYLETLLEKRNCIIWLLTFTKNSKLEKAIHNYRGGVISLELENEGDKWNIIPNNSTTVNLIVLQGLAMEIANRRGVTLSDFKKNHPGGHIGVQLKNVR
ncbi:SIS domain-containing protein [Treponema sp. UBA3813]|uniref:SIS domain-containing protein n=1 Tax=Treponema sp. UBA3813 TaxID=1947715 RepID=UPI0025DC71EF|nr:SIS domain-containing protein [Treponema sp. UBA3813]